MEYIYLGKIVNTHGIKGEVRIKSNFKYKNDVFNVNNKIYIGNNYEKQELNSYRVHKDYDMVTFKGINNINEVLKYKGLNVYFNKDEIKIKGILDEELIGMEVYGNSYIGKVKEIVNNINQQILVVENNNNINMIPYVNEFIKNIDLDKKRIDINEIEGLIHEN